MTGFSVNLWGATYFWVGTTGNWNDSANWSTTMNGTGGAGIPNASDIAVIDSITSSPQITLTADVTVDTLVLFGETNTTTIDLNSHTLTINTLYIGTSYNKGIVNETYNNVLANVLISNGTLQVTTFDSSSWGNNGSFTSSIFTVSNLTILINNWIGCSDSSGGISISGTGNIVVSGNIENPTGISPEPGTTSGGSLNISPANTPFSLSWTGATDTDWNTASNWTPTVVPAITTDVTIPDTTNKPVISEATTAEFKSITFEANAELTIIKDIELTSDLISKITEPSSGTATINISGKLTVSSDFTKEHLIINTNTLQTDAGFKCYSFKVNSQSTLNSSTPYVVAVAEDGMTFGDTVTVIAPGGSGIPIAGNVKTESPISVNITQGLLNHVPENDHKDWSSNATVVLYEGTTLSMAGNGTSYPVSIDASSGDVYIAGSGTISSLSDNSGSSANIHLGNSATTGSSYNQDTISISQDISLNTTGEFILDNTCSSLTGNHKITLNGNLRLFSTELSSQIPFDFIFNNDVTLPVSTTDKNFNIQSALFNGNVTINSPNTFGTFTAQTGNKIVTINDSQTVTNLLLSGTVSDPLYISGTGAFIISSQENGNYLSIGSDVKILSPSESTPDGINGAYYKSANSIPTAGTDDSDYLNVIKNGWRIKALSDFTYTWTGNAVTNQNDWANAANWDIGIVPGITTENQTKSSGAKVIIPDGKPAYPILDSTVYSVSDITIGSVNPSSDSCIKLQSGNLVSTGTLTNYGKIIYTAGGRITDSTNVINDSTNGTVEYLGSGTITTSITYNNLLISSANWTVPTTINANTIEINSTADIGNDSSPLLVNTDKLSAYTTAGDICIYNINETNSITFGNIKTDNGNIILKADIFNLPNTTEIDSGTKNTTFSTYTDSKDFTLSHLYYFIGTGNLYLGTQTHTGKITLGNVNNAELNTDTYITGSEIINAFNLDTNSKKLTINGDLSNIYNINGTSGIIEIKGNVTNSTSANFKASSDKTYFSGNVDFTNGFNSNNGTVIFTDSSKSSTLKGDIEFNNLTCTTPEKTLLFQAGKTFTVNGNFTITGSKDASTSVVTYVNLKSTNDGSQWNIKCTNGTTSSHPVNFAKIQDSNNISSFKLNANGPSYDAGNNINWNFVGLTYIWKTSAATNDWFTNTNWTPESLPGIGSNVEIPAAAKYPILTSAVVLSDSSTETENGKITLTDSNSVLDLQDQNITATKIINHGKIRLHGNQTVTADITNSFATGSTTPSTVEYYGTQANCNLLPFGNIYQNIVFSGSTNRTISNATQLQISGKAIFDSTGSISFSSADDLIIDKDGTASELTIDATGKIITLEGGLSASQTYIASTVITKGTGTLTGNTGATLNITGNFSTDSSAVTSLLIPAIINGSFTNEGTFEGNGTVSITGNITDYGIWNNTAQLTLNGTSNQNFTVKPETTYPSVKIDKSNGNTIFTGNTKITNFQDVATAGNITFQNGVSISNNVSFITTGAVILGSSASDASNFASFTHLSGETQIFGTTNSTEAEFSSVTLLSDAIVNASTGNITFNSSILGTDFKLTLNSANTIRLTTTNVKQLVFTGNAVSSIIEFSSNINTSQILTIPFKTKLLGNTTFSADTIFTSNSDLTLQNYSLICNNNVEIQNGLNISAGSIEIKKDLILFGPDYNDKDHLSLNNEIYIYTGKNADFTKQPGAKFKTDSGLSLLVAENFYANGITAESIGEWTLKLKSNKNTSANFAEAFYCNFSDSKCKILCHNSSSADAVSIAAEECHVAAGYENGWDIETYEIVDAYTVDDDIIFVKFNRPVRNLSNILNTKTNRINHSNGFYTGFYTDSKCTSPLPENNTTYSEVYIKADSTWNTDATGSNAGQTDSTDKENHHKNVKPHLDIKRNTVSGSDIYKSFITDLYGKRLLHYSNSGLGSIYDSTYDKCNPVLTKVKTGQELHTPYNASVGQSSQHSYDSHNFLEFTYSEPVNFGLNEPGKLWIPSTLFDENLQVTDDFGIITTDITADSSAGFTILGFGTIENGRIYTGRNGNPDKYMNALYRTTTHAIRLSIAGFTSGTVTDQEGNAYKNWIGYIENAVTPSGLVTIPENGNNLVTDLNGNIQMPVPDTIHVSVDSTINGVYSQWDTSEPIFAPLRLKPSILWNECKTQNMKEAVGATAGSGSTLDRIEFHFFDNEPLYTTDEPQWLTEKGWIRPDSGLHTNDVDLFDSSYTYCADIIGGARPFDPIQTNRSSGGIRFSSIYDISSAFMYSTNDNSTSPDTAFRTGPSAIHVGAKATLFTGSSTPRRSAEIKDGLYFGIELTDRNLPITQSFAVSYNENAGFITDLAGNRLRSTTLKTIDRTPPSFDFTLGAINKNELYIAFVKDLVTNSGELEYKDDDGNAILINDEFNDFIPNCFRLITISPSGSSAISITNQIDYTKPAIIEHIKNNTNSQEFTIIRLKLENNITLEDVKTLYLQLKCPDGYNETSQDPITGLNGAHVTFIQDYNGNYMQMFEAHCLSDFAINVVNPLYAYDSEMTYNNENLFEHIYSSESFAVHDWNEEQQNYGTLPANHSFEIYADLDDGTPEKINLPEGIQIFLSGNPLSASVSTQLNQDFKQKYRIWIPDVDHSLFKFISDVNNPLSNCDAFLASPADADDSSKIQFSIPKETVQNWGDNKQISFLFALTDSANNFVRIYNTPSYDATNGTYNLSLSTKNPLFALRLKNPDELSSIDLWSIKLKSIKEQRGGVTILNNVINPTYGEKTVLKINLPQDGKLNIAVMTIDGNIITYLNHGETTAGEHYFEWDGKNKKNNVVARGMYFIRITGSGFDETRKVMIVK